MVYQNKFVAVVKCNKKILREQGEYVTLPFGCEYSLLLKNMNSQRASVSIQIDGQEVLKNHTLIVDGNSEVEIERFIDSLSEGNRFKFIEKTNQISEHRGDKIDDGFIRIEVKYEKQIEAWTTIHNTVEHHDYHWYPVTPRGRRSSDMWGNPFEYTTSNNILIGSSTNCCDTTPRAKSGIDNMSNVSSYHSSVEPNESRKTLLDEMSMGEMPIMDEGITVPGSHSDQSFSLGTIGELESVSTVVIIRLRGTVPNSKMKVKKPVTVKTKLKCVTCGYTSRSSAKFCNKCGTALQII